MIKSNGIFNYDRKSNPRALIFRHSSKTNNENKTTKTLHNAIIKILDNYGNSFMSFDDIANQVKKKDLWVRPSDGQYPEGYQIRLRTVVQKKYKHLFEERNGKIRLKKT